MKRQTTVLQKLDTSTASTASTLTALQATTETMNRAIQRQLGILSEISVDITFDPGQKRIDILNRGNVNIELWGTKLDQQQPTMVNEPRIISRGGFYYILAETFYEEVSEKFPKGTDRIVPFEIYLKDDAGTEYLGKAKFLVKWNGDTPDIHSQLTIAGAQALEWHQGFIKIADQYRDTQSGKSARTADEILHIHLRRKGRYASATGPTQDQKKDRVGTRLRHKVLESDEKNRRRDRRKPS